MEERILELERILEETCDKHYNDCKNCPRSKECDEYQNLVVYKK